MKAVILVAGKGTRLMPLTKDKPKAMVEVAGKPILHHVFKRLPGGFEEVILVVSKKGGSIREYFGDSYLGFTIQYVVQEKQLGTGHALGLCKNLLKGDKFLVLLGDDLHSREALSRLSKEKLAILASKHEDPSSFGVFEVDENNIILSFEEKPKKPKSDLVSTGALLLDERVFDYPMPISPAGEYWLTDQVSAMMRDYPFKAVVTDFWQTISYPRDIGIAEAAIKAGH